MGSDRWHEANDPWRLRLELRAMQERAEKAESALAASQERVRGLEAALKIYEETLGALFSWELTNDAQENWKNALINGARKAVRELAGRSHEGGEK